MNRSQRLRSGYTLMELLVASASASLLLAGLSSSLYVASQSLGLEDSDMATGFRAARSTGRVLEDVREALAFSELTSTAITFTVPDRTGDGVAESIRYAWSGTAGDPLTYEFNGAAALTAIDDVRSLDFTATTRLIPASEVGPGEPDPILMFVVSDDRSPTNEEEARVSLFESWGYEVELVSDDAREEDYKTVGSTAVVVYVSGDADGTAVGTMLNDYALGVVTESLDHAIAMGLVYDGASATDTQVTVDLDTHHIATGLAAGVRTVLASEQPLYRFSSIQLGRDTMSVASIDDGGAQSSLLFVDAGDELGTSPVSWSAGRRCLLPWGDNGFSVAALNADGQTLTRQAIEWAVGAGSDTPNPGIHYRGFAEAKRGSNGTSVTIDLPSGVVEGDLLIAAVAADGEVGSSFDGPSGWIRTYRVSGDGVSLGVWWKLAGASEGSTHTFDWSSGQEAYGWIMRFDGHDPSAPLKTAGLLTGQSDRPVSPSVNTTVQEALVLRIGAFDDDDIDVDSPGVPNHSTVTMDESDNGNGTVSGAAVYRVQATVGSAGVENFSLTNNEQFVNATFSIAPDPNP